MTATEKEKIGNIAEIVNEMTTEERESVMLFVNGMIAMKSLMNKNTPSADHKNSQNEQRRNEI